MQLVLVGDLFQLPPVVTDGEREFFETRYPTPYFFSADRFSPEDFPTVALTTVFRQLGDQRLTGLLNAVREGVLVERARADLNARTDPEFEPPDDEFWLTLAPTNRVVSARNRQRLDRLPGEVSVHRAIRSGDLELFDPPVEEVLALKVGAQVMMLNNDSAGRWVNGTLGKITDLWCDDGELTVEVEFRDGTTSEVRPYTWEATRPVVEAGALRREVVGTYTQLPLKLAWAVTIHKSQGQTLDRLVVDLRGGAFDYGQVYVALSRCTSMDGLVLTRPVLPKDLKTDRRILRFLRSSTAPERAARTCAISILTVGMEGRMSRPRPVELAVAFDDGSAVSTLVNPQRDLDDARTAYGIAVDDVLLAPTLAEAWSAIAPLVDGCVPVGVDVDETLGLIDFELKRLGAVVPLPIGAEIPSSTIARGDRASLSAPTALARASAAISLAQRGPFDASGGSPFDLDDLAAGGAVEDAAAYLLTRDGAATPPSSAAMPTLSALMEVSRVLSAVILGRRLPEAEASRRPIRWSPTLCAPSSWSDSSRPPHAPPGLPRQLLDPARRTGADAGDRGRRRHHRGDQPGRQRISDALCRGSRVCFTGTAVDATGRCGPGRRSPRRPRGEALWRSGRSRSPGATRWWSPRSAPSPGRPARRRSSTNPCSRPTSSSSGSPPAGRR